MSLWAIPNKVIRLLNPIENGERLVTAIGAPLREAVAGE